MTRGAKAKQARRERAAEPKQQQGLPRTLVLLAVLGAAGLVVAGGLLWNSSRNDVEQVFAGVPATDPGPVHVHGLGINPSDGSLFIATHTGLFRVGKNSRKAVRIADRFQDTMGFSIVGANRFLGSGHPDAREQELPPLLGLIESTDAGKSWEPISLLGEADFHVLRSAGARVYGYDATNDRLLTSSDRGVTWKELDKPGPIVDLAFNAQVPRLVTTAAGSLEQGMYESRNGGQSWKRLNDAVGLLAWPAPNRLYLVDRLGQVLVSPNGGRTLMKRGEIGGEPAALLAVGTNELYAALHDGTIKRSTDGGASWNVRSRP